MSIDEKINLWRISDDTSCREIDSNDLIGGVEDNIDAGFSDESRAIISSSAYAWFLESIVKASSFHWDESEPRLMFESIRGQILGKFPTGKISRNERPSTYQVSFKLPWDSIKMALIEKNATLKFSLGDYLLNFLVFTASSRSQVQASTIGQYLSQTWAVGGHDLLEALAKSLDSQGQSCEGKSYFDYIEYLRSHSRSRTFRSDQG
jgi:hypothetical protein